MASKRSNETDRPVITLEALASDVQRRRAALANGVEIPRNGGTHRTPSKRALLQAIKDAGGNW